MTKDLKVKVPEPVKDMVLVRKDDLEDVLRILTYAFEKYDLPTPCIEDCKSIERLKLILS